MGRDVIRYSEAFKHQVVLELERGEIATQSEARARYGIRGSSTISRWLRTYGKAHLLSRVIRVEKPDERTQMEALKARIAELEHALVDSKVQEALSKAYFEIVCEQHGVTDVEQMRKKVAATLSRGRRRATV